MQGKCSNGCTVHKAMPHHAVRSMDLDTKLSTRFSEHEANVAIAISRSYTSAESVEWAKLHGHPASELQELHTIMESMSERHYTQEDLDAIL